ncbi:MAG: fibrobacter succinogenes major paralogous domain-containing protein [Dysgonamonadaceae bacterium]|jgi:uncharacterized protein (TIGR02145 family)|nr:fibrobacter succinogenes major paralogous domain-containing protein [Dysgonamonadaceae bacterium]
MKLKVFLLTLTLVMTSATSAKAQVTIGGMTDPKDGALLDLNSTAKGVLLLSNVSLTDLEKIPGGVFVGIANEQDNNTELTGAIVYNTNINTGRGLYVWNGVKWTTFTIGDGDFDPLVPGEVGVLKDLRDNETYLTGNFGTAGIWMLENLRYSGGLDEDTDYTYPGTDGTDATARKTAWNNGNQVYGLLYNWAAATNGAGSANGDEGGKAYDETYTRVLGVCPDGWYLPSDKDWSDLTSVIGNDVTGLYSTLAGTGSIGKKMRSATPVTTTDPDGASKPADQSGFDALLVGLVYTGGSYGFGEYTYFWSSSSRSSSDAWARALGHDLEEVSQGNAPRSYLQSVRCKKDN